MLFAATVAENVRLGRQSVTDDEMIEACKQANAHEFITVLPNGYNTRIGDGGVAVLSGGQKQVCVTPFLVIIHF